MNYNIVAVEPIGITPELSECLAAEFASKGARFTCYRDRKEDDNTLVQRMKDADIVIISNIKLNSSVLSQCPHLKLLAVAFTGLDHIAMDYCRNHNIVVVNASGYATTAVAELSIGLMIDTYRHITVLDMATREGGSRNNFLGRQLSGKTVGIIGTGAIGIKTAELLCHFGCKVIAWSRTQKSIVTEMGIPYFPLEEVMSHSDIISIHVPLTADTHHLISEQMIAKCKPTAIIINTSRGNVVDMDALAVALYNGKILGAGIDVFEKEPPLAQDHPLLAAPNCVVTPHIGYATREAFDIRIDIIINKIRDFINNNH